jgi:hypothetical protein
MCLTRVEACHAALGDLPAAAAALAQAATLDSARDPLREARRAHHALYERPEDVARLLALVEAAAAAREAAARA